MRPFNLSALLNIIIDEVLGTNNASFGEIFKQLKLYQKATGAN